MAITWSPTYLMSGASLSGLSNNDLTYTNASTATPWAFATVGKRTGKWYWEYSTGNSTSVSYQIGVAVGWDLRQPGNLASLLNSNGLFWCGDRSIGSAANTRYTGATVGVYPNSCVVGVAVDCDNGRIWFAKNNAWVLSGDPANGLNAVADAATHSWWKYDQILLPCVNGYVATTGVFDSASLTYTPPSGFSALTDSSDLDINHVTGELFRNVTRTAAEFGGRYRVHGTMSRSGVPGIYRIFLFDRRTKRARAATWSDENGAYSFDCLEYSENGYFAIAFDHSGTPLNASISDLITPELMA